MIEVINLSKKYDPRGIAGIHDISFQVERGKVFSLLGPNGSGKTTLLKLLCGLLKPDQGHVHLAGSASFFPCQEAPLDMNVQEFLINSVTLDTEEEKKVQLTRSLADTFEFTSQLRQNFNDLSSGQKQKVLLAKELINGPSLLLLDEPFTHLDPFIKKDILESLFINIRHKETTVIWVSHDLAEALKFSDVVGLLNFGKFEQIGSPETFIRHPRNLFVARFMGYNNFFPVHLKEGFWQTPWGPLSTDLKNKTQGLLVVPDSSWDVGEGIPFKVVKRLPNLQCIQYILEREGKTFLLERGPTERPLQEGGKVRLSIKQKDVFVIEL